MALPDNPSRVSVPSFRVIIQARMSSARFPGKVLAPFRGQPIISHVISRIATVLPREQIVVATSTHESDDPLAVYVDHLGVPVFRGPLDNVLRRFQLCAREYPSKWLFRVCADSPLLDPDLIPRMSAHGQRDDLELVTNVHPRTFPRGCSLEMLDTATFAQLNADRLSAEQREHVTKVYYDTPDHFRILNIESGDPTRSRINLCVDTIEDLRRLEQLPADPAGDIRQGRHLTTI